MIKIKSTSIAQGEKKPTKNKKNALRRQRFHFCDIGDELTGLSNTVLPGSALKNLPANAGVMGLNPQEGSGRPPGEGNGNPLQYSCLENPMGRET